MTLPRRAAAGLAVLATAAALLVTGCVPGAGSGSGAGKKASVSGSDDATVKDMQQKMDDAESAAAEADSDATQNN